MIGGAGRRIVTIGHRGARAMRPENTISAFEYAIAAGVDGLELDTVDFRICGPSNGLLRRSA